MTHKSPFSPELKKLIHDTDRKKDAINSICRPLKGSNNKLYFLIIDDLLYHFNDTPTGGCRSQIMKDNTLWTADSYPTLTDRYNKLLDKSVSIKTVKRYHTELQKKGLIQRSRHFFGGDNILHRSINAENIERLMMNTEAITRPVAKSGSIASEIYELIYGNHPLELDPKHLTYTTKADLNRLVEETIEAGNALFHLGNLSATKRKITQQARARIRRLVEMRILGPYFVRSLYEAHQHGEFNQPKKIRLPKFWPDWLELFYPDENPLSAGMAGSWFMPTVTEDNCPWADAGTISIHAACSELFNRRYEDDKAKKERADQAHEWEGYQPIRNNEDMEMERAAQELEEEQETV